MKPICNGFLILATFVISFYIGTAFFSVIDFPSSDTSWSDCNQPVCDGDDEFMLEIQQPIFRPSDFNKDGTPKYPGGAR
jgi:hypothetical protein